ncbi:hypothetical protein V4U86_07725 [Mycobacterium sp. AMU20-3851]|uniref:hypothetical protein n=1 Tax=Mycobacterium sp. AMU20-3851 TaxID=3122055 RepID=UPI003754A6B9
MRWVIGDGTGLAIPADPETLRHAGPDFLTTAMRRFGTLDADNTVDRITRFEECGGGSTGRKALLDVEYARAQPGLRTELFVKFSRDFDHPRRDRGKSQMELEVGFAALSARTELPVAVPACAFGDYHRESCTGLLVTERIGYGRGRVERHYEKCLDYAMPDQLGRYRALLTGVARLAGAHRSGLLPASVDAEFAFDAERVSVGKRIRCDDAELIDRVRRVVDFGATHPGLLPDGTAFADRMLGEVARVAAAEDDVLTWLQGTGAHNALCHWNANVDNAWFWRDPDGVLRCGLMDWGCVSVMNVAMALWGALCSAETELWRDHLDDLLEHFATEFAAAGGPELDTGLLRTQLVLYAVVMGVAWLLDTPRMVCAAIPDLAEVTDRRDPRIAGAEAVRAPLLMLSNVLHLWETEDIGALMRLVPT